MDARPLLYVAAAAVVLMAAVAVIGEVPRHPVDADVWVPRVATRSEAVAIARVVERVAPAPVAEVVEVPAGDMVAMALPDPEEVPGEARRTVRVGPGILAAEGLDAAIAETAGRSDVGGGMATVMREAKASGWEPVDPQGCGARCFGGSLRAAKRDCVFGEHRDEHGKCVPDDASPERTESAPRAAPPS